MSACLSALGIHGVGGKGNAFAAELKERKDVGAQLCWLPIDSGFCVLLCCRIAFMLCTYFLCRRHGRGLHNVAARDRGKAAYKDPALIDAALDDVGREQANTLGKQLCEAGVLVDVVLVSPLTRALQTAMVSQVDSSTRLHYPPLCTCKDCATCTTLNVLV